MSFDLKTLEPLAGALISAGAPILGGIIGGPFGAVIGTLLPQIAGAFGLAPDASPSQVTTAVQSDPDAATKLQALEDKAKAALDFAKLQADQNNAELQVQGGFWTRAFYSGWRPAFAISVVAWVNILLLHVYRGGELTPAFLALWNPVWVAFGGMLGLRTIEKVTGVALPSLHNIVNRVTKAKTRT